MRSFPWTARSARSIIAALAATAASAVALPAAAQMRTHDAADPWEPMNRRLFSVHQVLDKAFVRPLMLVYTRGTPRLLRRGLHNATLNLGEPITFLNDVLQVRPTKAGRTLTRFATNSSLGLLGVFDVASAAGLPPRHYSDFGQTLGRYGVGPGPFLIMPLLGPSSVRDLGGRVVDSYVDPVNLFQYEYDSTVRIARPAITGLELRALFDREIQQLDQTATDPYVTLRSAYLQNRRSLVRGGEVDVEALPSFEPEAAAPVPSASPTRQ